MNWSVSVFRGVLALAAFFTFAPMAYGANALRVMTFNIRYDNPSDGPNRWANRKTMVADLIKANECDVVGMQEALHRQIEDLKPLLDGYGWYGVGRDDGKQRGEYCPVFFRKSKLTVEDESTFWLSTTPDRPGSKSWDAAITRIATVIRLRSKATGGVFAVVNTHFDHRGSQARLESARLISARVAQMKRKRPKEPIIVMGDFNCLATSAPFQAIVAKPSMLRDSRAVSEAPFEGPNSTWNGFRSVQRGRRIDFIFVDDLWTVRRHTTFDQRTRGRFPSDHLPVLATVERDSAGSGRD